MKTIALHFQRVLIMAIFLLALIGFAVNRQEMTGEAAGAADLPLPALTQAQQASIDGANILLLEMPVYHFEYLPLIER
jgi:hypothetical protein